LANGQTTVSEARDDQNAFLVCGLPRPRGARQTFVREAMSAPARGIAVVMLRLALGWSTRPNQEPGGVHTSCAKNGTEGHHGCFVRSLAGDDRPATVQRTARPWARLVRARSKSLEIPLPAIREEAFGVLAPSPRQTRFAPTRPGLTLRDHQASSNRESRKNAAIPSYRRRQKETSHTCLPEAACS